MLRNNHAAFLLNLFFDKDIEGRSARHMGETRHGATETYG